LEAGQQIRDFILEVKIGAGGVGEVWRARHQHLDKFYAIKAVFRHLSNDPHFHDRFFQEAKAMAQLDHPHIVGLHDFFYLDGNAYMVMSYIEGGSLGDLLKKRGRLPLEEASQISSGILDALDFAHSRGVIHRDLKPSNILLTPNGHAYLVDFGIALVLGTPRMTQFGSNIGTLEYMSPEQIRADEIDHRTDVYSFGCVIYEMLTGSPPFGSVDDGKTDFDVMNGHMNSPTPSLRQIDPEIDENTDSVVSRAMAKDPSERFGGCKEMAEDLKAKADTVESVRVSSSKRDNRFTQSAGKSEKPRKPYLFIVVVILLLISVVITAAGWINQINLVDSLREKLAQQKIPTQQEPLDQQKTIDAAQTENKKLRESITRLAVQLEKAESELEKLKENRK
jgi:serine/threonine-protein kinase